MYQKSLANHMMFSFSGSQRSEEFDHISSNNPLRFETTKCSKQRIEQASIRTLFPKCVHKLGSPRFVLEAVS